MRSYTEIPALKNLVDAMLMDVRVNLQEDATNEQPALLCMLGLSDDGEELTGFVPKHVDYLMATEESKDMLSKIMDNAFTDPRSPVDALVLATEMWVSQRRKDDQKLDVPPSEDPDREEILFVVVRTKNSTEVLNFDIDRANRTVTQRDMPDGLNYAGRFVGAPVGAPEGETVH